MGSAPSLSGTKKKVKKQLEGALKGPIEGLQLAPEFFKLLSSPELAGTPLGQSYLAQQEVFNNILGGLTGQGMLAGKLPGDLASAIGENLASEQAARGTFGSPAGAIQAAMRFSGASEDIAQRRIQTALQAINQLGGAGVLPGASQFLQAGLEKSLTGAKIFAELGLAGANQQAQQNAAIGNVIGTALGGLTGGLAGGLGVLSGPLGIQGGLGGALGGFGLGTGFLPPSLLGGQ